MKERLDKLVLAAGLADTREKARTMIMEGLILVNGQREDKPGSMFKEDVLITAKEGGLKYVSRGGLKLEKAMKEFGLDLTGMTCMDVGASTGGFTDCMLQNGAARVYAIDVGYGQLDWKLREDPRVVCMEKTNFRYVVPEDLDPAAMPDFASVDVSFISLSRILPPAAAILPPGGEMVCLIKPQFEAGREKVGKKGVVRDPKVHEEVIDQALKTAQDNGFSVLGLSWSPIRGPEGNIEYLMYLRKRELSGDGQSPEESAAGTSDSGRTPAVSGPEAEGQGQSPQAPGPHRIREIVRRSHEDLG